MGSSTALLFKVFTKYFGKDTLLLKIKVKKKSTLYTGIVIQNGILFFPPHIFAMLTEYCVTDLIPSQL